MARPKGSKNSKTKVIPVLPDAKAYKATVKVMGKTYEACGDTISLAISNVKTGNCKGKAIVSITNAAGIKKDRILMPLIAWRLFNSRGLTQEIAIKNMSAQFQGL